MSVTYTADNDPDHLLGRPNGYTSKTTFTDGCIAPEPGLDSTSVQAGCSVEVFADAASAQRRQQHVRKAMPSMGIEYSYIRGTALVRVSGALTPVQAGEYQAAASSG